MTNETTEPKETTEESDSLLADDEGVSQARSRISRRTLLGALGVAGSATTGYFVIARSKDDANQNSDSTRGTELDTDPPDTQSVDQYLSRSITIDPFSPAELRQPDYQYEQEIVKADSSTDSNAFVIEQAEMRPFTGRVGDIIELTPRDESGYSTSELADLTRAVLGVGTEIEFETDHSTTTLRFQGGQVPQTDSYAVIAGDSSLERIFIIRNDSVETLEQTANELKISS